MPSAQPRNLLVLMTDQQRTDTLSCLGETPCRTPNLDRVAAEGVVFSKAYCPMPLCSPSRAAILTGRWPHANRVIENCIQPEGGTSTGLPGLEADETVVSELLAPAGVTCMYAGKWHLGRETERQREYARFTSHRDPAYLAGLRARGLDWDEMAVFEDLEWREGAPHCGASPLPAAENRDAFVADNALDMLEECAAGSEPFALWCSFYGPHGPFSVPEPWDRMYDPAAVELPPSFHDALEGKTRTQTRRRARGLERHLTEDEWRRVIAHYWGYVSFLDAQFGRLLDRLEALGLWEETAVLFLSDHGEMAGDHHSKGKGFDFYEGITRTPLMLRVPGVTDARVEPGLVSLIDVAPTLLDLFDLEAPADMQGRSLLPGLRGERPLAADAVFCEHHGRLKPGREAAAGRMIRTPSHKYAMYTWGEEELYDLVRDPHELVNQAANPGLAAVKRELRSRLESWMHQTGDFYPCVPEELLPTG